jgi:P27 family predicted phage terminase small subunit
MGKRGPKPLPTADKRLRGTLEKSRQAPDELELPPGCPNPPTSLIGDGRELWRDCAPVLAERGVLSNSDRASFEAMCRAFQSARDAEKELAKEGRVIPGERGNVINPWEKIAIQRWAEVVRFSAEFGLTPAARSRISAPDQKKKDPAEGFMFGGLKLVSGAKRGG